MLITRIIYGVILLLLLIGTKVGAQQFRVYGVVQDEQEMGIPFAAITYDATNSSTTDSLGAFSASLHGGAFSVVVRAAGYKTDTLLWKVGKGVKRRIITLKADHHLLTDVTITGSRATGNLKLLNGTEGTTIYAGKKNEIISLARLPVNTATNNSRQIYAQVPGINIIENDEAGVQLGIATRGLNPNRTTAFNSRQNGYDISADPIGYPETYYTPPSDGLASIEIIRGAASLQYGTQFGGLLNFHFKEGPTNKQLEFLSRETGGSYGFFSAFNSIGGQYKKAELLCFLRLSPQRWMAAECRLWRAQRLPRAEVCAFAESRAEPAIFAHDR